MDKLRIGGGTYWHRDLRLSCKVSVGSMGHAERVSEQASARASSGMTVHAKTKSYALENCSQHNARGAEGVVRG
jgi:hypothetical protein